MSTQPRGRRSVLEMDREIQELRKEVKIRRHEIVTLNAKNKKLKEEMESLEATIEVLSNDKLRETLRASIKEEGEGRTYSSEEVRKMFGLTEEELK